MKPIAAHDFNLPITDEAALREFVRLAWGVSIPDVQVCEEHSTPWRAFCEAYFAETPVSVWLASRGFGGKSFLLALLGLTEAVTLKADVRILGGSGEQAQRVHEYMRSFWRYRNAPRGLLATDPMKRLTRLTHGNVIEALVASEASVRGPHEQRLRVDECDVAELKIIDAALGQPMGYNDVKQQTVLSSTWQNAAGTMTEILRRAAANSFPVHRWCYRETVEPHGWLPQAEVAEKRKVITKRMFEVEYDLQTPNPGALAMDTAAVEKMFDSRLGKYDGRLGERICIEPPMKGAKYFHGTDWAKSVDYTVIVTFRHDVHPYKLVAFERTGRLPWPVMVKKFNDRVKEYPGKAAHDATGLGGVVADLLTISALNVQMVGRVRADMLSEYISAVEQGMFRSPRIEFMYGEHKYASNEDVYSGGSAHHLPDSISAGALALWARKHAGGVLFG